MDKLTIRIGTKEEVEGFSKKFIDDSKAALQKAKETNSLEDLLSIQTEIEEIPFLQEDFATVRSLLLSMKSYSSLILILHLVTVAETCSFMKNQGEKFVDALTRLCEMFIHFKKEE